MSHKTSPRDHRYILRRRLRYLEEVANGFHDQNEINALRWALEQLDPKGPRDE